MRVWSRNDYKNKKVSLWKLKFWVVFSTQEQYFQLYCWKISQDILYYWFGSSQALQPYISVFHEMLRFTTISTFITVFCFTQIFGSWIDFIMVSTLQISLSQISATHFSHVTSQHITVHITCGSASTYGSVILRLWNWPHTVACLTIPLPKPSSLLPSYPPTPAPCPNHLSVHPNILPNPSSY